MKRNRKVYVCISAFENGSDYDCYSGVFSEIRLEKLRSATDAGLKAQYAHAELALRGALRLAWDDARGEGPFMTDRDGWIGQGYRYAGGGMPVIDAGFISVTHTEGLAAAAFSFAPVGVDVERERAYSNKLAKRVLSEDEYGAYLASNDWAGFFFRKWTVKESFLKLTGKGLAGGMASVTADEKTGEIRSPGPGMRLTAKQIVLPQDAEKTVNTGRLFMSVCMPPDFELCLRSFSDTDKLFAFITDLPAQ